MQFMKSFFTGTDTDFLAGYRACKCLKGFYRTHMFEKCHKCFQGMACQDDHISLKSGYWWEWRNQTSKGRYQKFIKNLAAALPALGIDYVQYPHPIPTPHQCPREAFSYIEWPDSLEVIAEYSELLQLNVLQMVPLECLIKGLRVNAFGNMFTMMAVNSLVICVSGVAYGVRKVVIARNESLEEEEKSSKLSETKELVYRNLFFFLYVTYLNTCTTTANVLPLACQTLCRDEKEESCSKFLKADYSVRCHDQNYNEVILLGYISTAYVMILPAATFIALWKHRRVISGKGTAKLTQDSGSTAKVVRGLCFLFENYKPSSWYWELVEVCRKLILTSGLILVGQQSRSYIGLAWVVAGMYGVLFSSISPIQDVVENRMMVTSLCVTIVNLGIGAVSRIPAENIPNSKDSYSDTAFFKALVIASNTSVIGLLVGKKMLFIRIRFSSCRKSSLKYIYVLFRSLTILPHQN